MIDYDAPVSNRALQHNMNLVKLWRHDISKFTRLELFLLMLLEEGFDWMFTLFLLILLQDKRLFKTGLQLGPASTVIVTSVTKLAIEVWSIVSTFVAGNNSSVLDSSWTANPSMTSSNFWKLISSKEPRL